MSELAERIEALAEKQRNRKQQQQDESEQQQATIRRRFPEAVAFAGIVREVFGPECKVLAMSQADDRIETKLWRAMQGNGRAG